MRKYFYFVSEKAPLHGNVYAYDDPSVLAGKTRQLARQLKKDYLFNDGAKIHKFENKPPYRYLGVVS